MRWTRRQLRDSPLDGDYSAPHQRSPACGAASSAIESAAWFSPCLTAERYTQARERLARIADELRVKDINASVEVRSGAAAEEIAKAATDYGADLIVMGTRGRRGLQHLLNGSVTEQVIRRGRWPVLTIHQHGGASAATAA